uniref:Nuclear migration protein nudC n=1 Tax=Tabanus bromius TaxID=304241 RepID=A0A0K8TRF0_TABBR
MSFEIHDSMLMDILNDKRTIQGFMDAVFGFLARRTNFFRDDKWEEMIHPVCPKTSREDLVMIMMRKYMSHPRTVDVPLPISTIEVKTSNETQSNAGVETEVEEKILKQSDEQQACENQFQASEYYNGSACDKYCWSQTSSEVEVHVLLPENIKTSKDLKVTIDPQKILVRNSDNNKEIILEGKMREKIRNTDAVWTISKNKLQITLDKVKELWWDKFLEAENSIDVNKIDCTKPVEEFSEESQAAIEKLRWDEKQKLAGLPTSDDIKNQELLCKAWKAENSPFKGQPFDPTMVKFH